MNRRDLLAALGAAGGLAVLADEDGDLIGPVLDDPSGGDDGSGDGGNENENGDTLMIDGIPFSDVETIKIAEGSYGGSGATTIIQESADWTLMGGGIESTNNASLELRLADSSTTKTLVPNQTHDGDHVVPGPINGVRELELYSTVSENYWWLFFYVME